MPVRLDKHLVEGARSGGDGLERLIAAVWPEAFRIAFSILRDRGLAEDAAQEACAAIARSLSALKSADAFHTWSYKIVANYAIAASRSRSRSQALDAATDCGVHFDRSDALDLYAALAALSVVQRGVIILHYYVGLNSREIADATGLPSSTIRFRLMLARRELRKALGVKSGASVMRSSQEVSDVH